MNDAPTEEVVEVEAPEAEAEETETPETPEDVEASKDEPSDPSPEKPEDEEKEDKVQKRIDEITRIRREEERQRLRAEQERDELRQQLEQLKPKQAPGKTLADFDYDESRFQEYLTEQAAEAANAKVQERLDREKAIERQADFAVRESEFKEKAPDYHDVTRNPALTTMTQSIVEIAQGAEDGPALLYHLAKNREILDRLAYLSPLDQAREMGKLESVINQPKPPSVSKTPEPPPKIKAAEKATTIKASSADSDKLSTEEWLKRRNKELASRA